MEYDGEVFREILERRKIVCLYRHVPRGEIRRQIRVNILELILYTKFEIYSWNREPYCRRTIGPTATAKLRNTVILYGGNMISRRDVIRLSCNIARQREEPAPSST